jgi:hypothetical protein
MKKRAAGNGGSVESAGYPAGGEETTRSYLRWAAKKLAKRKSPLPKRKPCYIHWIDTGATLVARA